MAPPTKTYDETKTDSDNEFVNLSTEKFIGGSLKVIQDSLKNLTEQVYSLNERVKVLEDAGAPLE